MLKVKIEIQNKKFDVLFKDMEELQKEYKNIGFKLISIKKI